MTIHKNIAYFKDFYAARDHGEKYGKGFPQWRVVEYEIGYAVQAYISGPYFGPTGELA